DPSAAHAHRPWPVVVLTALGAWFSLVPLLMVLALLFEQSWRTGPGPYVCGVLLLGGALTVMRSRGLSLFMEQLAWPVLLLGLGAMAFGFARDFSLAGACVALSLTALLLSCLVPQPSLRALLGAATLQMATLAWAEVGGWRETQSRVAWAVHIAVLAVAALMYTRDVWAARDRTAPAVLAWSNSVLGGAAVAALASLASWSGMAMLLPAALGGNPSGAGGWQASADGAWLIWAGISAGAALLGAACLWRAWPAWRQPWWAGVLLALAGLSFLVPGLGLALAWLALCLLSSRPKLAA